MKKIRLDSSHINLFNIVNTSTTSSRYQYPTLVRRESQLRRILKNYYEVKAYLLKGTMQSIVLDIEQRLDLVLVRMCLARSLAESRQFIAHTKVRLNGVKVTRASLHLKEGDRIELDRSGLITVPPLLEEVYGVPEYLEVDFLTVSGVYLRSPQIHEIPLPFEVNSTLSLS